MAEFDEYAYLEKQLEAKDANGHKDDGTHKREKREKKDRTRDRDSERERTRDQDRDRKSSKREHRDKSPDRERKRHHSSHDHHRSERDRKHSSRPRSLEKRRERTPPEVREQREKERELKELDRDIRTVFAYNLPLKAEERDLFEFFSKAGPIEDVKIIMDRNTRKSKGFAYIEYTNKADIVTAMALTGQILMGQAVMVKSSEAEKNLAWEAAQAQNASMLQMSTIGNAGTGPCKLYIGNLHPNIQEQDLKQVFEAFGAVEYITLQKDPTGRSQGYGFVQYQTTPDATKAMQQLDGLDIAGSQISVKIAPLTPAETAAAAAAAAGLDLDDAEGEHGGLKLTANARAALMQRLSGPTDLGVLIADALGPLPGPPAMVPAGTVVMSAGAQALAMEQGILGPSSPIPTQCLLLKNMFDPKEETEPDWDQEIATDVTEECSKYGPVSHTHVDKNSKGFVYLKFVTVEGSAAAQKALHGRWFAGRQVVAEFQFTQIYNSYFQT
ncbi:splicing factor, CC1-like protein [Coccomyxa subellipsoidea C-169]|uniref:Splicing factor, CC1-like protein n=1 Tax=Coccomyxa subellipsoidea (strain C-169) TaxID=574566 RepID=I0Z4M8_COCSC|nr:splicing factor, CC1-like protein [Coccomyxa subellipsoidea C-169]EIE25597.1 splicing factor, CC1-like protein [Coccomyxa subellipsoidea C-169]|eukprot:XP_005650141.1 splicing factor, CC1-like protein [Coccomyxa subellipsoidea C-169]